MTTADDDFRPDGLAAAALDANFAELIRWYGSRPGGEIRAGDDVTCCSTGLAFRSVNCAVDIDLDPATADERIADVRDWFVARGVPWRWLAGPTSRPVDLGERLVRAGFELVSDGAGMALDLTGFEPEAPPAGVEIETVDDLAGLDDWERLQRRALALDDIRTRAWRDAHDRALSGDLPMRVLGREARRRPGRRIGAVRRGRRGRHLQRRDRPRGSRSGDRTGGHHRRPRRGCRAPPPDSGARCVGDGLPGLSPARIPGGLATAILRAHVGSERSAYGPAV